MALTDYVIMKGTDYQAICDKLREGTGNTLLLKAGDLVGEIGTILSDKEAYEQTVAGILDRSLQNIEIPKSVTTIGSYAFRGCLGLESIEIPEGVTTIGSYAFYGATNLKSIKLPSTLRIIKNDAFASCGSLTSIIIPEGVTEIGNGLFNGCKKLSSITLPSTLTTVGNHIFCNCTALVGSVTIPANVKTIGQYVFTGSNVSGVIFENTTGWKCGTSATSITTSVNSSSMADAATMATLLRGSWVSYYWARS